MNTQIQLNIHEVEMLKEIHSVMCKYKGNTRDFGVQLIHSHFPITDREILYETHDCKKRTLTITPILLEKVTSNPPVATAWSFKEDGTITVSMFCCDNDDGSVFPGTND